MKLFKLCSAVLLMFVTIAAIAQAPAPKTDTLEPAWNVSVNGGFSNVNNAATNNGFITSESIRVATHWAFRSDQFITLSPSTVIVLGGPEYRFSLAHLIKGSPYAANANAVEGFAHAGAGTIRSSSVGTDGSTTLSAARFAYGIGGGFDIKVSDNVSLRPLDLTYVRGSMLQRGGAFLGNHINFAAGLGLRF